MIKSWSAFRLPNLKIIGLASIFLGLFATNPFSGFRLQDDELPAQAPKEQASAEFDEKPLAAPTEIPAPVVAVESLGLDLTGAREALAFYKSGELALGDNAAKTAREEIILTTLEWVALQRFPREAGFERLQAFARAHPDWPSRQWLRKRSEEALYGDRKPIATIKAVFASNPPLTPAGKLALARVYEQELKPAEAANLIRSVWREDDLNITLENKIRTEFGAYLEKSDHKFRADRLLYKDQTAAALRAANLAGPDVTALAKYRIAANHETANDRLLAAVPMPLRADPGIIFAKIQNFRRGEKIHEAAALLLTASHDPLWVINGDEWWVERRLVARKLLDLGDAETAYRICKEHDASSHEMKMEAEFHAGWIALRFLNDAAKAAQHFSTLAKLAETPISSARAAYWQGRAAEISPATEVKVSANQFYLKAAEYSSTYYGQVARAKLGLQNFKLRNLTDEAMGEARLEPVKVIELLYALGEKDIAAKLATEAAQNLQDASQIAALGTIIEKEQDASVALRFGKLANQRGFAMDELAFPDYGIPTFEPLQNSVNRSMVYAIARQESAFATNASSTAGAKGLMQMIVSTARRTAERAGIPFDEQRLLADPKFNAQLGAAHLGALLAEYHGSYILAFAAYNAGGKKVKQWIDAYGDPSRAGVDPIDWIERIPFTETRNYVQRVIENLIIYKLRFGEGTTAMNGLLDNLMKAQARL